MTVSHGRGQGQRPADNASRPLRALSALHGLLAALAWTITVTPAYALSWEYVPRFSTGVQYETNPGYAIDEFEDDGIAGTIDASVSLNGESQRSTLVFEPRISASFVSGSDRDNQDLDTFDYYLPLRATWSEPRARYELSAGYNFLTSNEYDVTDPNTLLPSGQYGRVVVNDDQSTFYLAPSASFQVTELDALVLALNASDVRYDDAALTGRSNYNSASARTAWIHSIGPQTRIIGGVNLNWFDANRPSRLLTPNDLPFINPSLVCRNSANQLILCEVDNKTWSYGADLGLEYSLTETTTFGVTAGAARSEIEVSGRSGVDADEDPSTPDLPCYDANQQVFVSCEARTDSDTFTGRIFLDQKTGDTITAGLSIARSLQPSSDGAQVTNDVANAYIRKSFTNRLSGSIGVSYIRQEAVGARAGGQAAARFDTEYQRLDTELTYSLTETWSVSSAYRYAQDEQKSGNSYTAENHTIGVYVQYTGLGSH